MDVEHYLPQKSFWEIFRWPTKLTGVVLRTLSFGKDKATRWINFVSYGAAVVVMVFFFPSTWVTRLFAGEQAVQRIQPFFARLWLVCFGLDVRGWYHSQIDRNRPYLLMAEHMHILDVPIFPSTWPTPTYAIGAKEYEDYPMFGWILRTAGTKFIERRDTEQAKSDLVRLSGEMQLHGFSALVCPMGTRHPSADYLPFKKGVFHFATQIKLPVIPVYLIGLEELALDQAFCKPGRVDVVYGEPILVEDNEVEFESVDALLDLVRGRMLDESALLRRDRKTLFN